MIIPKGVFGIARCAAPEPTRYGINGVFVNRVANGECLAAATDGRRLVVAEWADAEWAAKWRKKYKGRPHRRDGFSAVIVRKSWDAIRRLIRNCERDLIFECADLKERTNCAAVLVRVPRGDDIHVTHAAVDSASFPNFRKVIPKYKAGDSEAITYCVNPKLLEELLAAVREAGTDEENKAVKLVIPRDSSKPMIVWGHNGAGVSVTGVLMPVLMRAYGGK